MNHFWGTPIWNAYQKFGERFPALNPHPNSEQGLKDLLARSRHLMKTKEFVYASLGGRDRSTVPAELMLHMDIERVLAAIPPTPSGLYTIRKGAERVWRLAPKVPGRAPKEYEGAPKEYEHTNNTMAISLNYDVKMDCC